jgi:RimJ/RimL family protein N-acetyltransferase
MTVPLFLTRPIRTDRLVLRPFDHGDLEGLFDMQSRPEVARYLYWEPRTRAEVSATIEQKIACRRIVGEGDVLSLAVNMADGGPAIGDLMLRYSSAAHGQAEVGYILHPDLQGRGLATEAVRALVDLAFDGLDVHRVHAQLDARNSPSARLLERLGLRREAHLVQNEWVKGEWTDEVIFGVLAAEWAASRLGRS